jgi:alpha-tubulin suppressor-like RCC1 family protein
MLFSCFLPTHLATTRVDSTQQYPFCKNPKIITWGNTDTGALGVGSATSRIFADGPISSSVLNGKTAIRIASYYTHTILLANDSKLYSFGDNSFYGALGIGTNTANSATVAVDQTASVFAGTSVANGVDTFDTGNQFSVVLLANGNIATFGRNDYGQLVRF